MFWATSVWADTAPDKPPDQTCTSYAKVYPHAEVVLAQAALIKDMAQTPRGNDNIGALSNPFEDPKTYPDIKLDPAYTLVNAYQSVFSANYNFAYGLAELSTALAMQNDICEKSVLFALGAAVRYEAAENLMSGAGNDLSNAQLGLGAACKLSGTIYIPQFSDSVCWVSQMGEDLDLSRVERRACR